MEFGGGGDGVCPWVIREDLAREVTFEQRAG